MLNERFPDKNIHGGQSYRFLGNHMTSKTRKYLHKLSHQALRRHQSQIPPVRRRLVCPTPRQNVCACVNFGTSGLHVWFGCPN